MTVPSRTRRTAGRRSPAPAIRRSTSASDRTSSNEPVWCQRWGATPKRLVRNVSTSPTHRPSASGERRAARASGVRLVGVRVGGPLVGVDGVGVVGLVRRVGRVVVGRLAGLLVPPLGGDVGVREVGDHVSHVGSLRLVVPEKPNPATPPGNRGTRALLPGGCGSAPLPGLAARLPDRLLGVLPGGLRLPQDPLALGLLAGLRVEGLV